MLGWPIRNSNEKHTANISSPISKNIQDKVNRASIAAYVPKVSCQFDRSLFQMIKTSFFLFYSPFIIISTFYLKAKV